MSNAEHSQYEFKRHNPPSRNLISSSVENISDLHALWSQSNDRQKQAQAMGVFPGNREPLERNSCELLRHVLIDGQIITYNKDAGEFYDGGLLLFATQNDASICPKCSAIALEANIDCTNPAPQII